MNMEASNSEVTQPAEAPAPPLEPHTDPSTPVEPSAPQPEVAPPTAEPQTPVQTDPEGNQVAVGITSTDPGLPVVDGEVQDPTPPASEATSEAPSAPGSEPTPDPVAPTPVPVEATHDQAPVGIVGGGSESAAPGYVVPPPGSPAVAAPPVLGSDGFASGGGAITADSPALQHHITPIGGEGEGVGGSDAPTLGAPPPPEGSDTVPPQGVH